MADYTIIVRPQPQPHIIVSQKQGPQGDVTPEALAAKEAAEEAARDSRHSADESAESAANAKESENNAADSARALIPYKAEPWEPDKIYNYPDAVVYEDGYFYRCIGENVIGELPNISNNWVRFLDVDDFFEYDDDGDLTPTQYGRHGNRWLLDEDGDVMPHPDLNKNPPRNIVPRKDKEISLGKPEKKWDKIYGYEGHFGNFSNVDNTSDINKPLSIPQKTYIDNQDSTVLASAKDYTDTHTANKLNPHETDRAQIGLENVDNVQQASKIEFEANKLTVQAEISRVETIAKGASRAFVFATYQQLIDWLNGSYVRPDGKTRADLITGDNLYIVDRLTPDYWWDGAQIQELETQKVDLTDYPHSADVQGMIAEEAAKLQSQISFLDSNKAPTIHAHTGNQISADRGNAGTDLGTAGEFRWRQYGNNHTIIDNSASEYPGGNTNAQNPWSATYPVLMGYNGSQTYGVRVDSARYADTAGSALQFLELDEYGDLMPIA